MRTGIAHAGLSLLVFGALAASLGVGIHFSGNPAEAGPRQHLALFETGPEETPALKARLKGEAPTLMTAGTVVVADAGEDVSGDEPSLGVEYADLSAPDTAAQSTTPAPQPDDGGVRINGKMVRPGESYGEVSKVVSLDTAPVQGLTERVNGLSLPRISESGETPSDVYARPFSNPESKPVIAIVVGGLGINATHTRSAIEELPPEVTLSFAPDANNIQYWINKARDSGHEVLMELPMEAYDYGRMKMHPQTLLAGDTGARNLPRIERLLAKGRGYFGVINYQGAKFADDPGAVGPMMKVIRDRGLALVEDASFQESEFDKVAARNQMKYVRANSTIDAKLTAAEIGSELMALETQSKEHGAAMGAGYAFPVTIQTVKEWTEDLNSRGIVLAPVSALTSVIPAEITEGKRLQTGSLTQAAVNPEG
ncbi:hypothetical protein HY3_08100 [Hyphomonas pacifica]|uniref:Divergent polysaccharide deacetylase n=1 Tax=Hyphomonas pacifica TaxID=1280941 RepID=A0A8B2PPH9_9PROT|nr:hypothetical protein HY3_08100 [Hyphomonas pacifica]RAN36852.1 hypothetical protein HY11_11460 [Hyphomonas pacifica]